MTMNDTIAELTALLEKVTPSAIDEVRSHYEQPYSDPCREAKYGREIVLWLFPIVVHMRNALPELLAYIAELERDLAGSVEETRANFSAPYDAANRVIPGLEKERDAALARAEKAEAERDVLIEKLDNTIELCILCEHYRHEPGYTGNPADLCLYKGDCQLTWNIYAADEAAKREGENGMNNYQVQIVYNDRGWERCRVLPNQPTEQAAFEYAEKTLVIEKIKDAEIMVHEDGSDFWKVKDRHGRITQRPTTEAAKRESSEV